MYRGSQPIRSGSSPPGSLPPRSTKAKHPSLHQENDMCGVASMIASKEEMLETESVAYKADEPSILHVLVDCVQQYSCR